MKRSILLLGLLAAGVSRAEDMHYVIKVTPALVYVDAGSRAGVQVGDVYAVLRPEGRHLALVGEVEMVRVAAEFSIGEITYVVEGETIEVLQRAVERARWEEMAAAEPEAPPRPGGKGPKRSLLVLGGGELGRDAELVWQPSTHRLLGARPAAGLGLGLRLGQVLGEHWRLNLTYRAGLGADVEALAIEADMHLLARRYERAGPYVGAGVGMHQLSWDPPGNTEDSANKVGFNLMAGVQVPGPWALLLEVGYQKVLKWNDLIDVSHVRLFAGLGRMF